MSSMMPSGHKENGDSKLIYGLLFILLIPHKYLGRMKTCKFIKITLLYIVATMTKDIASFSIGSPHHLQMTWRNISSLWSI